VSAGVLQCVERLVEELGSVDPAVLSGDDCAALVERLAVAEKACAGLRARAAARAVDCGAHRARGHADAADWLAGVSGVSRGEARSTLEAAAVLGAVPDVGEAVAAGALSLEQAREIARTEADCPGSARELVALASRAGLQAVRDEARRLRLVAADVEELHRRQVAARQFRHWLDGEGMVCFRGALPPHVGVPIVNRLDAECDRVLRSARRDGSTEPRDAHAADAFVRLVEGKGSGRAASKDLVIVIDLRAWRRVRPCPMSPATFWGAAPYRSRWAVGSPRTPSSRQWSTTEWPSARCGTSAVACLPSCAPPSTWARRRGWRASSAPTAAAGATACSGTTSTPWPTAVPPPTTTSGPAVGPATPRRPSATGRPGCWAAAGGAAVARASLPLARDMGRRVCRVGDGPTSRPTRARSHSSAGRT